MSTPISNIVNKQSLVLGGFAITIGTLLWLFNLLTETPIRVNQQALLSRSLLEVLPNHYYDNDLSGSAISVFDPVGQQPRTVYTARLNNQPSAAVVQTSAPDGYAGDIDLLVGINIDGTITGVRVLQHRETPGLGDDIELRKSNWILDFNGKSLQVPLLWAVARDGGAFDQFTGATITPRAVVGAVRQALIFFQSHQSEIFSKSNE